MVTLFSKSTQNITASYHLHCPTCPSHRPLTWSTEAAFTCVSQSHQPQRFFLKEGIPCSYAQNLPVATHLTQSERQDFKMAHQSIYLTGCVHTQPPTPTLGPLWPLPSLTSPPPHTADHCCFTGFCFSLNLSGTLPLHSPFWSLGMPMTGSLALSKS